LSLTAAILTENMLELQLELFVDLGRAFDRVGGRPDRVLSIERAEHIQRVDWLAQEPGTGTP
jgi:hypothetical protein